MFTARNPTNALAVIGAFLALAALAAAPPAIAATPADPVLAFHAGLLKAAKTGWPPSGPEMEALIAREFDVTAITRVVLGAQAAVATQAQKDRLSHALTLRIEREVLRYRSPSADDGFAVASVSLIGPGDWLVTTRVNPPRVVPGQTTAVQPAVPTWRVRLGVGKPRIVDTMREGVSTTQVQRDDFSSALRGHTLDQVIAMVEQRAEAKPAQW